MSTTFTHEQPLVSTTYLHFPRTSAPRMYLSLLALKVADAASTVELRPRWRRTVESMGHGDHRGSFPKIRVTRWIANMSLQVTFGRCRAIYSPSRSGSTSSISP